MSKNAKFIAHGAIVFKTIIIGGLTISRSS
jgi:hypothetical protein